MDMESKAKSWRDTIKIHPAADLFPMMSDPELRELGEDIKRNGLRLPIYMWAPEESSRSYQLVDGRNRLTAMEFVGIRVLGENGFNDEQIHPFKNINWYYCEHLDPWVRQSRR
ncbi:ParB N-terminal domain-containing protein [Rhizobium sp. CC1099]|uniref:ParB N-terminal domain-containing protein n=1 Tax=Rhizobium sp. CC1099 TaxID=3039160 RepID=UPI0024B12E7F|nr:ParB N-terminal domain-containing protein [Rhizobium sp. CC1099]WFU88742.1 ParB N-terminal domain-containing protein [Rhizobium sp. CC1099]